MSTNKIFEQLLQGGKQFVDQKKSSITSSETTSKQVMDKMNSFGGGAVTGGIFGLLLGNKKSRKYVGKAAKWGSLAAVGGAAYYAYQKWQQDKGVSLTQADTPATEPSKQAEISHSSHQPESTNEILLLDAMISAARADGHLDNEERENIEKQLNNLGVVDEIQTLIENALNKPLDPVALAKRVSSPEQACEVYLVSLLAIDVDHFMERTYLDELAKQLNLPPELVQELEKQQLE